MHRPSQLAIVHDAAAGTFSVESNDAAFAASGASYDATSGELLNCSGGICSAAPGSLAASLQPSASGASGAASPAALLALAAGDGANNVSQATPADTTGQGAVAGGTPDTVATDGLTLLAAVGLSSSGDNSADVPEPGMLLLFGAASAALVLRRRRRAAA